MEIFGDNFGRRIWFTVGDSTLTISLQDLTEDLEYERSATVNILGNLSHLMNCTLSQLEKKLADRFGDKTDSFDLLTHFLSANNIAYGYHSASKSR